MAFRKLLPEIELELCNDYSNTRMSEQELSEKYNISKGSIRDIRKRNNIPKRKRNAPSTNMLNLNERYFENIDNNTKAYWMGFIAADGCLKKRPGIYENYILSIGLATKDINHLEKFRKEIDAETSIVIENCFHKKMQKYYETAYLRIPRTIMCEDLIRHGVGRNKSEELSLPNLPDNLMRHYIRGYFDGDGWWVENGMSMVFGIISSVEKFVVEIQEFIKIKCNLKTNANIHFNKNAYQFAYNCSFQTRHIYKYLYEDGGPWLDRKYEKSTKYFQNYNNIFNIHE